LRHFLGVFAVVQIAKRQLFDSSAVCCGQVAERTLIASAEALHQVPVGLGLTHGPVSVRGMKTPPAR
jgi:hypothetical protein